MLITYFKYCHFYHKKITYFSPSFWVLYFWKWNPRACENPSWLYQESNLALPGVRHGSVSNSSWLWEESVTCGGWLLLLLVISQRDRLLSEPWLTVRITMKDSSQSHDGFLVEPWRIFHRPWFMLSHSKTKKQGVN